MFCCNAWNVPRIAHPIAFVAFALMSDFTDICELANPKTCNCANSTRPSRDVAVLDENISKVRPEHTHTESVEFDVK